MSALHSVMREGWSVDAELMALASTAGTAVVTALTTDARERTRTAVGSWRDATLALLAAPTGNARVYQAGRDLHITER